MFKEPLDKVANRMPNNACKFLECVRKKQRMCWIVLFVWWACVAVFVVAVSELMKDVSDTVVMVVFYGSAFLIYIPAMQLYRLKCPYCHKYAGALPLFRYKFIYCKACGERIECN